MPSLFYVLTVHFPFLNLDRSFFPDVDFFLDTDVSSSVGDIDASVDDVFDGAPTSSPLSEDDEDEDAAELDRDVPVTTGCVVELTDAWLPAGAPVADGANDVDDDNVNDAPPLLLDNAFSYDCCNCRCGCCCEDACSPFLGTTPVASLPLAVAAINAKDKFLDSSSAAELELLCLA